MYQISTQAVLPSLPDWTNLNPEFMLLQLNDKLIDTQNAIKRICEQRLDHEYFTYADFEQVQGLLQSVHHWWSPLAELQSVKNEPVIRSVMEKSQDPWISFGTWLSHYRPLYDHLMSIHKTRYTQLNLEQQRVLELYILDCQKQGMHLPEDKKARLKSLELSLAQCELSFENNLIDASLAGGIWKENDEHLEGLPENLIVYAKNEATKEGKIGYKFPLNDATVPLVLAFAKDRKFRERMHRAYTSRASNHAEGSLKKFDNGPNLAKILNLRQQISSLLGYENFAALKLCDRMLNRPNEVSNFLDQLIQAVKPQSTVDQKMLQDFAMQHLKLSKLAPHDRAFCSRLMKQKNYHIDIEEMRQYFPLKNVLNGLFALIESFFGVTFTQNTSVICWDPDVVFYEVREKDGGSLWGGVYFDLFARERKQSGAWVSELYGLQKSDCISRPVGSLHTNFMRTSQDQEPLLTHLEIVTLFHEMGHMLQMLLTTVNESAVSGLSGIPLDAVEIASQWMEEWAWDKEVLIGISGHVETGESINPNTITALLKARSHQAGYDLMRQISFSFFDLTLHESIKNFNSDDVFNVWMRIRKDLMPDKEAPYSSFPHSFSHIFSSSYAAGYYSYLWSEVLAIDWFFSIKEVQGDEKSQLIKLKKTLFAQGGSRLTASQFRDYRNRNPEVGFLLKRRHLDCDQAEETGA